MRNINPIVAIVIGTISVVILGLIPVIFQIATWLIFVLGFVAGIIFWTVMVLIVTIVIPLIILGKIAGW